MAQQYQCPLCEDYHAEREGSVKAHISSKKDDLHKGKSGPGYHDQIPKVEIDDSTVGATPEFPENDENDESETAEASESANCCSNPEIAGSEGDYFRLDSGTILQLEAGESICKNCEQIHQ